MAEELHAKRTQSDALKLESIRADFPIFAHGDHGEPLAFLDSAASAQKPKIVLNAMENFYQKHYANIHRGDYKLSRESTKAYELAREKLAAFLNAKSPRECIFTRNATEAINLVASSWGDAELKPSDEILITHMEHHANIVPWQLLAQRRKARLVVAGVDDKGGLLLEDFFAKLSERTKLVSFCHASNALGSLNPAEAMIKAAKQKGALVLVDAAQSAAHLKLDVQKLGCDFLVFSGHKVFGPTGIGALWGKLDLLEGMQPYQSGGDMIEKVSFEHTTFAAPPERFEAGTPHIAGAVGLAAALDYLQNLDATLITNHEQSLLRTLTEGLDALGGVRIFGADGPKVSLVSFELEGVHSSDVGALLDANGIAVRVGHHCTMPLWDRLGVTGSVRASMAFYNTNEDIQRLLSGLQKAKDLFLS